MVEGFAFLCGFCLTLRGCPSVQQHADLTSGASTVFDFCMRFPLKRSWTALRKVAVRVGLNLQAGQELLISASTEMLPLVRRITEHAYKAGATLVTTLYGDDETALARYKFANDESFDKAPCVAGGWDCGCVPERCGAAGACRGESGVAGGAGSGEGFTGEYCGSKANKPAMELITRHAINWSILAAATPAWAKLVFPD